MKFNQTMKTKVMQKPVLKFFVRNKPLGNNPGLKKAVLLTLLIINNILIWHGAIDFQEKHKLKIASANWSSSPGVVQGQAKLKADKEESAPSHTLKEKTVSMSAYTSRVEETDSTPCISADGTNICKYDGCIVASNDYPFDTVLSIEGFGECVVKDRMSSRYTGTDNMDMYFGKDLEGALQFGRRNLKIKITS